MYMPGTVAPEQVQQQGMQQALIEALRQPQQQMTAPAQVGKVQSAGYLGQGMNTGAIGGALGNSFGGIGGISGGGGFGVTPQASNTAALIRAS